MLKELSLQNVGPATSMDLEFADRLNVLTGDNGLGKTFLLDVAWWSLTRSWAGYPAIPRGRKRQAKIAFSFEAASKKHRYAATFHRDTQTWKGPAGRPANPGLVLYAQVDGGFAVWDPHRNYSKAESERPPAYVFRPNEVWDGLAGGDGEHLCSGLILDWASWQREGGRAFSLLTAVLRELSPDRASPMMPGGLTRISLSDVRDMPTLRTAESPDTPIVHASAGMRRICALAYLLVWTWLEHEKAATLLGKRPTRQVTFLIDEVDTHLHPRWQRVVLPALLGVVNRLVTGEQAKVQVIVATHSPLVLASIETVFDPEQDALWNLAPHPDLGAAVVQLPWAKQGDAVAWLVSDAFGLRQGRSQEAEEAIEAAEAWMREDRVGLPPALRSQQAIHDALCRVLAGDDPFWPRWIVATDERSASPQQRKKANA